MSTENIEPVSVEERLRQIAASIQGNTKWVAHTNRELRDKVDISAKEIEKLTIQIRESTSQARSAITDLTLAIQTSAQSSTKLSRWMVILTFALAVATAIAATAAILQWKTQAGYP